MSSIIAGRRPVIEALKAGSKIEKVVFLIGVQGRIIDEIKTLADRNKVQFSFVNKTTFRELATDATTQGVVAVLPSKTFVTVDRMFEAAAQRGERGFLLLLDGIEDPHNLGALVRTAECAGAHGVILPRHHAATVTSTVVKASAGATEHMLMAEVTNLVPTIERLKEEGYWVVGLDASGQKDYTLLDYRDPVALVIGNEGKGIRKLVREHCDFLVRIPLRGQVESLNASVAGALAMYEVVRQRGQSC